MAIAYTALTRKEKEIKHHRYRISSYVYDTYLVAEEIVTDRTQFFSVKTQVTFIDFRFTRLYTEVPYSILSHTLSLRLVIYHSHVYSHSDRA